jgi:hypothetical protein
LESLAEPEAMISCPLSRNLALLALPPSLEKKGGNYEATDSIVADINSRTQLSSMGMLYSASKEYLLLRGDTPTSSLEYFDYVQRQRAKGILRR